MKQIVRRLIHQRGLNGVLTDQDGEACSVRKDVSLRMHGKGVRVNPRELASLITINSFKGCQSGNAGVVGKYSMSRRACDHQRTQKIK